MIPLDQCKHGFLYKINSRNLTFGVYNQKDKGFIGIREKFGDHYLFTEYHWDTGAPYGTVKPQEEIGIIPSDIEITETLGTVDSITERPVEFDKPVSNGGKGWYFTDTGESSTDIRAVRKGNPKLFAYLENYPGSEPAKWSRNNFTKKD